MAYLIHIRVTDTSIENIKTIVNHYAQMFTKFLIVSHNASNFHFHAVFVSKTKQVQTIRRKLSKIYSNSRLFSVSPCNETMYNYIIKEGSTVVYTNFSEQELEQKRNESKQYVEQLKTVTKRKKMDLKTLLYNHYSHHKQQKLRVTKEDIVQTMANIIEDNDLTYPIKWSGIRMVNDIYFSCNYTKKRTDVLTELYSMYID